MSNRENFININTKTLSELLNNNNNKIIYIGRHTCAPCAVMEPILSNILEEKNIKAYYYNTKIAREEELEDFEDMIENIDAHYIPLILYYQGNKEVDRLDYYDFAESKNNINKFIEKALENIDEILYEGDKYETFL